ncbi:DUF1471 family protein YdgH [Serratia odorifera]|uniref:YdgH/BhsA/McbA-like domain-containing protein n=2 Tax=Serratia odorifera TaxID=618 RepID=D4E640_SEROD|nr:DUF1471 family protein YdgH [Serratia odorifera]EFE94769.1 hypothetical protein HMPREF0758_3640 [Serratia odorifera DSM 4582]MBJ2064803.1 DUF1471 domain-containing protein [Serratia odorifera]PNK89524.1 DUF1471 domain-containing protein [Serratia odorifera]RII70890.1 DUF1471 domain-containing protein [Serratia odorifera]VDZ63055.1 putative biofilm stress and motility protein A [Serratia odorifera]
MKLKTTIIASALFTLTALSAHAAQELTPEKAAAIKPFDRITITGRFIAINEAADAVSRRADKLGADAFYIQDINNANNGGNWRVTADIYHKDAPEVSKDTNYREFNGVKELPKDQAYLLEPYDTVSVSGFFRSQPDVNDAISKAASKKGAASFFIVRQVDANQGGNQYVTAYIYKADAPKRVVQSPDAIPADSEAGKAALAAGGAAAAQVEIPGVASSGSPSRDVGRFFETQSSTGQRYTVTLPDGTKIQEVNNVTAAQMQPFDSVTFTGHFNSMTDVSTEVAKRAAAKGAKYYHVTRQWQNKSGGNLTVSADLFK